MFGAVTGGLDTTAIPGASSVTIVSNRGFGVRVNDSAGEPTINGPFSVNLPAGNSDLLVAVGSSTNALLALKIIRNQLVPGTLNAGNTVVFQSSDETTLQPLTINNVPAGLPEPFVNVDYHSSNSLTFRVDFNFSNTQFSTEYVAVPSGVLQNGDFYNFFISTQGTNASTGEFQSVSTTQSLVGGGPVTISLPDTFSYSGPSPASFPTFTLNYSGFSTVLGQKAEISSFPDRNTTHQISVLATAAFQNGANTIAVPNLSSLPGFLAAFPSGQIVEWSATIYGGTSEPAQDLITPDVADPNAGGIFSEVSTSGAYTAP
jgi:hypothetical protein